jgi:hypothetical protein
MTALWTRRRAESFDALLGGGRLDGDGVDAIDGHTAELLELVGALRSVPSTEARPEFVTSLRERLMVAAETELTPVPAGPGRDVARLTIKPAKTRRERRVSLALGTAAIIGATTSMAVASQGAIPGDALYPLKRAIENTQAGFSVGDDAKGEQLLGNASGRLDEIDELTSRSDPDAALVTQTLDTFSDQASEAGGLLIADYQEHGDEGSIQQLHQFAFDSVEALSSLEASIPASAHDALLNAARTVFALDSAAVQACPQCGDGLTEAPAQLLAGATTGVDQTTATEAGAPLPGTGTASDGVKASEHPQSGGKDNGRPSAVNPPASPVTIPSTAPSSSSDDNAGDLGDALPTLGTQTGNGQGGQGGHHGGKGKGDLGPVTGTVTDTVNDVVDGVVEGVNGLLNGLSGGQTGP